MGRVVVKRNDLPQIISKIKPALGDGVKETATMMGEELTGRVWRDHGTIAKTIDDLDPSQLHATVAVGLHESKGFYSRFHEWGTHKMAARPVVGPVAHEYEVIFPQIVAKHIRKACGA